MPAITELPCEVLCLILRNLDNVGPTLLTCRYVHECFKEYQMVIVCRQITPTLIPYSVAVVEAWCQRHLSPERFARISFNTKDHSSLLRSMPTGLVRMMAHTHHMIHNLVADFATSAWAYVARRSSFSYTSSEIMSISPSEYFRFCRAFYQLELFHLLWRIRGYRQPDLLSECTLLCFSSECSPWEMEQVSSVYNFLDEMLLEDSYDFVAHDIEVARPTYGKLSSYQSAVARHLRRLWLSQGLGFVYRLMTITSDDSKRSLLRSRRGLSAPDFKYYIRVGLEKYTEDDLNAAGACPKDQLRSFMSWRDDDNTDNGPFEAWYASHEDMPAGKWAMLTVNAWHRRCAYVFWDWDRIQNNDLLPWFKSISGSRSPPYYISRAYDERQESFRERSAFRKRDLTKYQYWKYQYCCKGDYRPVTFPSLKLTTS
ncbi:hypothetical protein GGR51DRAFT_556452 [Nemania sp. FL0031]|nr:hypothetical protein GGR51DRAFT_556452 [Nemania sp. FL0031]